MSIPKVNKINKQESGFLVKTKNADVANEVDKDLKKLEEKDSKHDGVADLFDQEDEDIEMSEADESGSESSEKINSQGSSNASSEVISTEDKLKELKNSIIKCEAQLADDALALADAILADATSDELIALESKSELKSKILIHLNRTYEQLAGKSTGVVKKRSERSIKSRENDAKVVVVQQHKFVPKGLPVFQWDTKVSDKSARIFENPDECCKVFEKIIFTNGMDINNEWQRLITPCLWSEDLNNFRDRQFKKNENCTWEEFKKALVAEFGKNAQQLADEANEKIMGIKMKSYETLEEFIERFNKYRNRSEFKDDLKFTTVAFRRGLFTDLKNMVEKQINTKQADVVAQRAQGKEVEPFVVTMEYLLSVSRSTYKDEGLGEKLKIFQESKRQRELVQPAPRSNYYRNSYKDNNRSNDYQKSNNSNRNGYSNGENYTHSKRKRINSYSY